MLNIRYPNTMSSVEVYDKTKATKWSEVITKRRIRWFGHMALICSPCFTQVLIVYPRLSISVFSFEMLVVITSVLFFAFSEISDWLHHLWRIRTRSGCRQRSTMEHKWFRDRRPSTLKLALTFASARREINAATCNPPPLSVWGGWCSPRSRPNLGKQASGQT